MDLDAEIEQVWRCTWTLSMNELINALEAVIELVWRCAMVGADRVNLEMKCEAVIERFWRSTCRQ